jgi:hypothetical protein
MMLRFITTLLLMLAVSLPALVSAEEEYWEYTFRPGDSIWTIAEKYTTSVSNWDEIQRINNIRQGPDRKIRPGTRIIIPVSMLKQQPTPALVIALSGDVNLLRANGDSAILKVGDSLYSGDRVVTAEQQNLRIQFADKSELQVLANSIVILDKLSHHKQTGMVDTRVRLNSGSINTWVEKQGTDSHYEIRTPAAITAVRGTSFRMTSDDQTSRTEVTEGFVAVTVGDSEKIIQHGYGIVAVKDQPLPEPVKLLSSPELTLEQAEDQTTVQVSWPSLDGASYYRYQLATDEKFNQLTIDSTTAENYIEMTQLSAGHYYLRVRAIDQFELEGIDSVTNFVIKEPAPPQVDDDSYWVVIMTIGILLMFL